MIHEYSIVVQTIFQMAPWLRDCIFLLRQGNTYNKEESILIKAFYYMAIKLEATYFITYFDNNFSCILSPATWYFSVFTAQISTLLILVHLQPKVKTYSLSLIKWMQDIHNILCCLFLD